MNRNEILFDRAKAIIPGGVNSPVRAFWHAVLPAATKSSSLKAAITAIPTACW